MERWPLLHTTVKAARAEHAQVPVHRAPIRTPLGLIMRLTQGKTSSKGMLPFFFGKTMGEADERLPRLAIGLGVVVDRRARFFPMRALAEPVVEDWSGRALRISLGDLDGAPHATWVDEGSHPMQLLARWYGFSSTYPGCELYLS